jgi:nucleoid-associated protein YejK
MVYLLISRKLFTICVCNMNSLGVSWDSYGDISIFQRTAGIATAEAEGEDESQNYNLLAKGPSRVRVRDAFLLFLPFRCYPECPSLQ